MPKSFKDAVTAEQQLAVAQVAEKIKQDHDQQLKALFAGFAGTSAIIKELEAQNEQLKEENKELKAENEQLKKEIKQLKAENEETKAFNDIMEENNKKLNNMLKIKSVMYESLQKTYIRQSMEFASLHEKIADFDRRQSVSNKVIMALRAKK